MLQHRGGSKDEIHVVVYDATGEITGAPNTVLEKFTYLSKANNGRTSEGAQNYYPQVLQTNQIGSTGVLMNL